MHSRFHSPVEIIGLATGWGVAGALDGWLETGWPWLGRDNLAVTGGWDIRLVPASLAR